MLKDITLGQFFPGNSLLHKTDPRIKLIILTVYLIMVLAANTLVSIAAIAMITFVLVLVSGINLKIIAKSLKPLLFILIFTAVINVFFMKGDNILFEWYFIKIYKEGLMNAVLMITRLISLITGTSVLLTYTTSPLELTDAIERLFSPLKKIKVPVHEFAMMMTIALRFIPTLIEETDKIISAQKARGADFETGGLLKRAKALIPILIPLFVSAFRRADELAEAMECRCYKGGEGRTKMKQMKSHPADYVFLLVMIGLCVAVYFINSADFLI
ncbi:MAG: transporter [Clostridiales bacterium GWF2_36_10]|nr:MAG: transporter [Clostridiales bacterium GWF2_36_10]HAN21456.1 transporter [Clostridiales bacterium]